MLARVRGALPRLREASDVSFDKQPSDNLDIIFAASRSLSGEPSTPHFSKGMSLFCYIFEDWCRLNYYLTFLAFEAEVPRLAGLQLPFTRFSSEVIAVSASSIHLYQLSLPCHINVSPSLQMSLEWAVIAVLAHGNAVLCSHAANRGCVPLLAFCGFQLQRQSNFCAAHGSQAAPAWLALR